MLGICPPGLATVMDKFYPGERGRWHPEISLLFPFPSVKLMNGVGSKSCEAYFVLEPINNLL